MGLRAARRPAAAAAIAGRRRPVARRARLLFRKPPRRERQGEAAAGLDAALSILSRGTEGGARLISCKGAKRAVRAASLKSASPFLTFVLRLSKHRPSSGGAERKNGPSPSSEPAPAEAGGERVRFEARSSNRPLFALSGDFSDGGPVTATHQTGEG